MTGNVELVLLAWVTQHTARRKNGLKSMKTQQGSFQTHLYTLQLALLCSALQSLTLKKKILKNYLFVLVFRLQTREDWLKFTALRWQESTMEQKCCHRSPTALTAFSKQCSGDAPQGVLVTLPVRKDSLLNKRIRAYHRKEIRGTSQIGEFIK